MIENVIEGLKKECVEVNALKQRELNYPKLIQSLKENNYSEEQIKNQLNRNRFETLSALLLATESREIKFESDLGRRLWRNVIEYLKENGTKKELSFVEAGLYIPEKKTRSIFVDMAADFIGMFSMGIMFGIIPWYRVSNKIRDSTACRYVEKRLFS